MDDLFSLSALTEPFCLRFLCTALVISFQPLTCRCLNIPVFLHIQVHSEDDVPSVMIKPR
jgi:hypothetical protein